MSRNKGDGQVITGGRSIKHHRVNASLHHSSWPVNPVDDLDAAPASKRAKRHRIPRRGHHASEEQTNQEKAEGQDSLSPDAV